MLKLYDLTIEYNAITVTSALLLCLKIARLLNDNLTDLQCKGVHHDVTRQDATRCIIQTYICLGDILSLQDE